MSFEFSTEFKDEKKHPAVVAWMNLVFQKNMRSVDCDPFFFAHKLYSLLLNLSREKG